ncbi:GNAT family N-acetyltransferase [Ferrimonas marina]|uniref:Acetyltransferase (GNAT) family protein n=1 Tax=Ferrimonas marina TaxID=299255 RepID=A0A1M5ZEP1_9GAMM|nr:GNAT family N-acetyltransferase [Ferrimonas marina]SHI22644.1 Acetyltransferase (GNAT) family protein [Ferrimonas marina]
MSQTVTPELHYTPLQPEHFAQVVALGNAVHGEGYLTLPILEDWAQRGHAKGINASYVALNQGRLVGFRITFAVGQWQPDDWCTPSQWPVNPAQVCYFKCNTVAPDCQGQGIGSAMLSHSISAAQQQGAVAGLAHIWKQSPGNSAMRYFQRCGGVLIASHPGKWRQASLEGYDCVVCGIPCSCEAAEMLLDFAQLPAALADKVASTR